MSKPIKILLVVIGGTLGCILLAVIGLMVFVDANQFKSRVEIAASRLLAMNVVVEGDLEVTLFPRLHLTLNELHLRNQEMDIASMQASTLWIDLWPLLRQEVRVNRLALIEPRVTITKDNQGKFNFERTQPLLSESSPLTLSRLSLVDATLVYKDQRSGQELIARDCQLDVRDLNAASNSNNQTKTDPSHNRRGHLNFSSVFSCEKILVDGYQIGNLEIVANKDADEFNLEPITLQVFDTKGVGSILADLSTDTPQYHLAFSLPQFPIESFFNTVTQDQTGKQIASGAMDFSVSLSMQGKTFKDIIQSAQGHFSLRGENLTMNNTDLDQQFEEFESSQHFSLVDVGAFFYAGPLGLLLTKGHDFSSVLRGSGGHTEIPILTSEWQVKNGVAKAVDVAMATTKNRIAIHGELDFNRRRYNDVTVALIDAEGCVAVQQEIHGEFSQPEVEQPNILKSLAGPVINLLEKGRDLFPGGKCEVFYEGTVAPPK